MNIAVVRGRVLRPPTERQLSSGTRLVSIDVGVTYDDRPGETLEVVWADPPATAVLPRQGNDVVAVGRIRRRFFRTTAGATISRTEVVAETLLTARQTAKINRCLEQVAASLAAG